MNLILEEIIAKKREDLGEKKKRISLQDLRDQVGKGQKSGVFYLTRRRLAEKQGGGVFYRSIAESVNSPAVIAEVKFTSPSGEIPACRQAGLRNDIIKDLLRRVKEYEAGGAGAVSIITEPHFFKGNVDFIGKVKEAVKLPILQKDFVIDEYQIYEAKQAGTDALLLIARLVDNKTLERFVEICLAEGIEPVVEVFSEEDLEKAVETKTRFIAVNARDLDTFEVNVERACKLMKKIPERFIRLGFSGIQSEDEVRQYKEAGARGILIGTALMRTRNVGEFLQGLEVTRGSSKCKDQISKSS